MFVLGISLVSCPFSTAATTVNSVREEEVAISQLMKQIAARPEFGEMTRLNTEVIARLKTLLHSPNSYDYPFDSLLHIGKVVSPDGNWRIFTWNNPLPGGFQKMFGFLQVRMENEGPVVVYDLIDSRSKIPTPMTQVLTPQQWYGALYYQTVKKKAGKVIYYALIGVDLNDLFTSKRVIDILYFDEQGNPHFGAPIFDNGKRLFSRVIFEYSAKATMMMRYMDESDMIIFDHLSPSEPQYVNDFRFYGPDFSYDGFKFEKGKWLLHSDLDMRNPKRPLPKNKPVVKVFDSIKP
ncbi:hypothetical protein SAMN05216323_11172 [Williamwhitmania taraxaci]|uniref:Uncharacterized protein n=1 Tax=Williamwhitmania taraxaci TaxID=1640674 RepID=A0A1G6TB53_9BACT|nr:hypothetical protein SAMN05216323_11172 [Williamwhitmania taraxaci]